ncbi:Uncharacterised protein [Zhongshania aliphaticivorans]|uniref:Uncharacterized protein n=1 Tax=Zhongshania aliphaticivorans TaxID=1470434 RepID=A0A5S9MXV1_9GAMM|nr:hypothetical protein [Zhongshania aliphaticivorans]CAA0081981.1 Uncharacterised protein [Zhongshania aliphaticivorans]CAA0084540.1 Uncharacterised protein [Zhongshania aliphaticivorans]
MYDYSIGLAAFDFVPIALSGIGLYFLSKTATLWNPQWRGLAQFGALLILAGAISKASWKLIVATQKIDISWMNDALFFCLAPGMIILASAIWGASNNKGANAKRITLVTSGLLVIAALAIALIWPEQRYSTFYLLALTTLGNLALASQLIVKSWKLKRLNASVMFLCNILAVFVMAGLARVPNQTEGLQWIAELTNTFSQAAISWASYLLYSTIKASSSENTSHDIASK